MVAENAANRRSHPFQFADHFDGRKVSHGIAKKVEPLCAELPQMIDGRTKSGGVTVGVRQDPDHRYAFIHASTFSSDQINRR